MFQTSDFRLQTSDFRLQTSDFGRNREQVNRLSRCSFHLLTLLFSVLFACIYTTSIAQANAWITGNEYTVFSSTGAVSQALPQPGGAGNYAGQVAEFNQYIEYSEETEILFFIIDSNVYDDEGYLIADSNAGTNCVTCIPQSLANLTAIRYSDSCERFWIVFGQFVSFIDLSLPNPVTIGRMGQILNVSLGEEDIFGITPPAGSTPYAVYLEGILENFISVIQPFTFSYPNGLGVNNIGILDSGGLINRYPCIGLPTFVGPHLGDMVPIMDAYYNDPAGLKYIALTGNNTPSIFEVSPSGIELIDTWAAAGFNSEPLTAYSSLEFGRSNDSTPFLVSAWNNSGTIQLNQSNLFIYEGSNSFALNSSIGVNAHIGGLPGLIGDVAISPSGDFVYFTLDDFPYFGYYQRSTNSTGDLLAVLTSAQAQAASGSQIEVQHINGQPMLLYADATGIHGLTSPDDPTSMSFQQNVVASTNIAELNPPLTGQFNKYLLQHQPFNEFYQDESDHVNCCPYLTSNIWMGETRFPTTETWSPNSNPFPSEVGGVIHFGGDLIFASGAHITIDDLEFRFGPDAQVIIEPGAYVELNGTLWTSSCDLMWPGVTVLGMTNAQHSISQSPMINGNQGYLRMNNSTIEHAHLGVRVGGTATQNGGILRTYDSRFRNNREDVQISPYMFINGAGAVAGNRCLFRNTTFITDDALNLPQLTPLTHLALRGVYGMLIGDCSFMNTTPYSTHSWNQRGSGITSRSASFNLSGTNTPYDPVADNDDATSFYQLQFGIKSWGFNNILATYRCRYQEFQECAYGIANFQTDHIEVYENNFSLMTFSPFSDLETMIRGMYITGSTG